MLIDGLAQWVPDDGHRADMLPLTGSGKVMKHVLREQLSGEGTT